MTKTTNDKTDVEVGLEHGMVAYLGSEAEAGLDCGAEDKIM